MKIEQFQKELQALVKKIAPNLYLDVFRNCSQFTILDCISFIKYNFAIDKIEWEENSTDKMRESLIKIRLLQALEDVKILTNKSIEGIKDVK